MHCGPGHEHVLQARMRSR